MRFERRPRHSATTPPTVQRMDAVPLLTDFIKSRIIPAALVETEKAALAQRNTPKDRDAAALAWRQARKLFYALPPASRESLRVLFTDDTLPATSAYWIHKIAEEADRAETTLPAITWDGIEFYRYAGGRWHTADNAQTPPTTQAIQ